MARPNLKLKLAPTNGERFKMTKHQPLTGAERQRRYRQRQKLGRRIIPVELGDDHIEYLIDVGLLNENEAFNDANIAGAIARLAGSPNRTKQ